MIIHQASRRYSRPRATMRPQDGCGGLQPEAKKAQSCLGEDKECHLKGGEHEKG